MAVADRTVSFANDTRYNRGVAAKIAKWRVEESSHAD